MSQLENQVISKKDSYTIQVKKSVPVQFNFTVLYLKEQRQKIVDQQIRDNEQREKEIAEVDAYLAECTKLGVAEKPVDTIESVENSEIIE